jgi:septal ring factor EnvC (AmiA/AmiB activator)
MATRQSTFEKAINDFQSDVDRLTARIKKVDTDHAEARKVLDAQLNAAQNSLDFMKKQQAESKL